MNTIKYAHEANNIYLTVINDGNGSECGLDYKRRCELAENGVLEYRSACARVARKYGGNRLDVLSAATAVQSYYRNHVAESKRITP